MTMTGKDRQRLPTTNAQGGGNYMNMVDLLNRGTHVVAEHDSPVALTRSAELVLAAVSAYPTYSVIAATAAAERVLGAMMVMSPDLRVGQANDVVIFDVNIASGTVLARAAERLRTQGHTGSIVAVAVHALCEGPASIRGTDDLVVLDGSGSSHQDTHARGKRFLVAL
jgi:hypothetical protein